MECIDGIVRDVLFEFVAYCRVVGHEPTKATINEFCDKYGVEHVKSSKTWESRLAKCYPDTPVNKWETERSAPKLTPDNIDAMIIDQQYRVFPGTETTICCLKLVNGFTVTGESACVSPENFDANIGKEIAFENAREQIWKLEGYLLKHRLYENENPDIHKIAQVAYTVTNEYGALDGTIARKQWCDLNKSEIINILKKTSNVINNAVYICKNDFDTMFVMTVRAMIDANAIQPTET